MQDFEYYDWRPCMQAMGIPNKIYPMMTMPEQQLETMYPKIYYIIYPVVVHHCDMMDSTYGCMYMPKREEVEHMIDNIYTKVEVDVDVAIKQEPRESEERQFGFGERLLLRGLIGVLLLRELLRRRRHPFFGSPYGRGFGPGFGGGFNGGPGYY